jgi:hypothetical protein
MINEKSKIIIFSQPDEVFIPRKIPISQYADHGA